MYFTNHCIQSITVIFASRKDHNARTENVSSRVVVRRILSQEGVSLMIRRNWEWIRRNRCLSCERNNNLLQLFCFFPVSELVRTEPGHRRDRRFGARTIWSDTRSHWSSPSALSQERVLALLRGLSTHDLTSGLPRTENNTNKILGF
jgi:hypothetical protein